MNRTQRFATGLIAVLMLGTIVLMPARFPSHATYSSSVLRQTGPIVAAAEVSAESRRTRSATSPSTK